MTSIARKISAISVIIPALNEAADIGRTVSGALAAGATEVIVVDGGSRDRTVAVCRALGVRVLASKPGRAKQMNAGARAAQGDILLFLHADTLLPHNFTTEVRRTCSNKNIAAGAFQLRIDQPGWGLRCIEAAANLRATLLRMPYGDQAIFLTGRMFEAVGGYEEVPLLEDVLLVNQLRKAGRIKISKAAVTTSARRWRRLGIFKTTLVNQLIMAAYLLGVSPQRLQHWYRIGKKT